MEFVPAIREYWPIAPLVAPTVILRDKTRPLLIVNCPTPRSPTTVSPFVACNCVPAKNTVPVESAVTANCRPLLNECASPINAKVAATALLPTVKVLPLATWVKLLVTTPPLSENWLRAPLVTTI